jgi:hypothetical protein
LRITGTSAFDHENDGRTGCLRLPLMAANIVRRR